MSLLEKILVKEFEKFITIKKTTKQYTAQQPVEREELAEEGIDLLSIPWIEKDN